MNTEMIQRLESKSRVGQFINQLENEFEFSKKVAQAVYQSAREVFELDLVDPEVLKTNGQIIKTVVSQKAPHGPSIEELEKIQVTLTVNAGKEDQRIRRQQGTKALRQHQIMRMVEEANNQGGSLTQEDLADLLGVKRRTIQRDIKDLKQDGIMVATRGTLKDIGRGSSHKVQIVERYLKGYTYSEISRRMRHCYFSIQRYLEHFARVVYLAREKMSVIKIAFVVGITDKLAKEYLQLYDKYNCPEYKDRLEDMITVREAPLKKNNFRKEDKK